MIIQSSFGAFLCKYSKYLTVKDVLWCGLLKFDVPHKGNAVWFVRRVFVVVVGGNQQLGVLREVNKSEEHTGTAGRVQMLRKCQPTYATQSRA